MLVKLYDPNGNIKKIFGNELKDIGDFSAQENGSMGRLQIMLNQEVNDLYEIGDEIKYFHNNQLLFWGKILEIEYEENIDFNLITLNCVSIGNWISNYKLNKDYDDTLVNIVQDLISSYNSTLNREYLKLGNIIESGNIQIQIGEKTYLEYFTEAAKKSGQNFFIDKNGYVHFAKGKTITLYFGKEVNSIKIIKTSDVIVNVPDIVNNITVQLNKQANYYDIQPLDYLKILNTNKLNGIYKVSKITYGKETANLELDNFISFTKLLGD